MAKVQVSFRAVVSDKNLAVLVRAHCSWVDIQIRIQLLHCNFNSSGFQQAAQRGGGDTFPQAGDHPASNKNKLRWHFSTPKKDNS